MDCETVQLMIVNGQPLSEDGAAHVHGCEECRFLAALSSQLGASASDAGGDPRGPALDLLNRALAANEPLLGRWRLEELRGRGGQGVVYRATDGETGETVALKVVRDREETGLAEVVNMRRVRHPNVCRVYHTERFGSLRLIMMEYMDGPALSALPALDAPTARGVVSRDRRRGPGGPRGGGAPPGSRAVERVGPQRRGGRHRLRPVPIDRGRRHRRH